MARSSCFVNFSIVQLQTGQLKMVIQANKSAKWISYFKDKLRSLDIELGLFLSGIIAPRRYA